MRVLNFNLKVWENIFQKAWKINTKQTYNYLFFFKMLTNLFLCLLSQLKYQRSLIYPKMCHIVMSNYIFVTWRGYLTIAGATAIYIILKSF